MHPGLGLDPKLVNPANAEDVDVESVEGLAGGAWRARRRQNLVFQIISTRYAHIPRAEIAKIVIIAGGPVNAVNFAPSCIENSAVIQPIDKSLSLRWDGVTGILEHSRHQFFKRCARCRIQIRRNGTSHIAWRDKGSSRGG